MPLLPRVIIGIISVQLVCFWGFLQPRQLSIKHTSQQVTASQMCRCTQPVLWAVCCMLQTLQYKEFRRQKNVSHSMLVMHPNVVSNGATRTWSRNYNVCKCLQKFANVYKCLQKSTIVPVDGTFAQRSVVLSYNIICSCPTLSYEVPQVNLPPAPPFFVFPVPFLDCEDLQTCAGLSGSNPTPQTSLAFKSIQYEAVFFGLLPDVCNIINQTVSLGVVLAAMVRFVF